MILKESRSPGNEAPARYDPRAGSRHGAGNVQT